MTSEPQRCATCPLRRQKAFKSNTDDEIAFIQQMKDREVLHPPGATLVSEGAMNPKLFTLLEGWAFRYKTLSDGRRQILSLLMPGDLIGLQAKLFDEASHAVEALTDVRLCTFARDRTWDVFKKYPSIAFDMTWLCAHEERIVDEALLSVGQRSAPERVAWLFLHLWQRAHSLGMVDQGVLAFPLTQAHIADALGLSLVHTNRTLQKLRTRKLLSLSGGVMRDVDEAGLRHLARVWADPDDRRPLM